MPKVHLKDEEPLEVQQVRVKENDWVFALDGGEKTRAGWIDLEPVAGFPPEQVKKVEIDDDVYTESYLVEEEYSETRELEGGARGESVTEFKPVHRIELEYQIEQRLSVVVE